MATSSTSYSVIERSDLGPDVTIVTVEEVRRFSLQATSRQVFTLVSHADGSDRLVVPNGQVLRFLDRGDLPARFQAVLDFMVENV